MTTLRKPRPYEIHPNVTPINAEIVKAAKAHVLHCGCEIKPGYYYTRICAKVNGSFVAEKHHVGRLCVEVLH